MSAGRLRSLGRFIGRVLAKARRDGLGLRTSALAFTTLISLVPLLAVVSFFVARTLREDDGQTVRLLAQLLPYRAESIDAALDAFVASAGSVSGLGLLGFLFASLSAFLAVESTLHRVFGVGSEPSLLRRLGAYATLVFWGPALIGATYSALLVLAQRPGFSRLVRESVLLALLPVAVTLIGVTMLFWRASSGRVRFADAAVGAAVSTLALELLKRGFGLYVAGFTAVQRVVYGSFAIALFFLLSVQLAWWILLVGAEIAVCRSRPDEPRPEAPPLGPDAGWRALEALAALARAHGGDAKTAVALADAARIEPAELRPLLSPLVERGLVRPPLAADGAWALALAPRELSVTRLLDAYAAEPPAAPALAELRRRAAAAAAAEAGELTLADLLDGRAAAPGEPTD